MFQPNDRYAGKPSFIKKIFAIIFVFFVASLVFWFAYHLYSDFVAYESGETITLDERIFLLYGLLGKWPIVLAFAALGIFILFGSLKQFKADWVVDDEDEN